jgi:hypothetical protein
VFVGHSAGGLNACTMSKLAHQKGIPVSTVVTMGTPYSENYSANDLVDPSTRLVVAESAQDEVNRNTDLWGYSAVPKDLSKHPNALHIHYDQGDHGSYYLAGELQNTMRRALDDQQQDTIYDRHAYSDAFDKPTYLM